MENSLSAFGDSLLSRVENLISRDDVYKSEVKTKEDSFNKTKSLIATLDKDKLLLEKGLVAFNQFTVELTQGTVNHLEALVNQGLAQVFDNESVTYRLKIELITRKSNNQANFYLIKEQIGSAALETRLDDNGFGIQSFVGLILRFYFLLQNNLPRVLFIDEGLTAISVDHLPKLKQFLDQLCEKFNFAILLVAHDSDLFTLGDYFYTVTSDGTLEEGVFGE